MFSFVFQIAWMTVVLLLYAAIVTILVLKYLRTRDVGFIWLGVAVVLWPFVSHLMDYGALVLIRHSVERNVPGFWPFGLIRKRQVTPWQIVNFVQVFQRLVGPALVLIAVLYLSKHQPKPAPEI